MRRWIPIAALCVPALIATPRAQDPIYPPLVNADIAAAIGRGLAFLVKSQATEGSWRNAGKSGVYPTAMTALAGMALIGSGSTPTRGRHWRAVRGAVDFLVEQAQPDGVITVAYQEARSMYGHGFATMFLAQVYGMEEDAARQRRLHQVLDKAVDVMVGSQASIGGWNYTPGQTGDEGSVTITQLQALRACRNAGIVVPPKTIQAAVGYIAKSANPDGGIRYRASQGGPSRPGITAPAVASLYNAGQYDHPMAEKAMAYALRTNPIRGHGRHFYYIHLYLAQACYQKGGETWEDYYPKLAAYLLSQQSADGSWSGDDVGSVYGTAVALTVLQLPYALVPIYQR